VIKCNKIKIRVCLKIQMYMIKKPYKKDWKLKDINSFETVQNNWERVILKKNWKRLLLEIMKPNMNRTSPRRMDIEYKMLIEADRISTIIKMFKKTEDKPTILMIQVKTIHKTLIKEKRIKIVKNIWLLLQLKIRQKIS